MLHTHIANRASSYTAVLSNSGKTTRTLTTGASAQRFGSAKIPFTGVNFTMPLPANVTVKAYSSRPKVTTVPVLTNGVFTWNMGTTVKAGGKVRVSLKLMAAHCTTPEPLKLDGKFTYSTLNGLGSASACLKKPFYVWGTGCAPIPKSAHGTKPSAKTDFSCNCTSCKINGQKTATCNLSTCACTSN